MIFALALSSSTAISPSNDSRRTDNQIGTFVNHIHALALYFAFYNFCRIHKTLKVSPAMAAGITDRLWSLDDIVAKIDSMAPALKARGPYKKRVAL